MNPVGRRIKHLRKLRKLTQNDVAVFVGVQRVSVSKWETQNDVFNTPKGEHLFKLAQILEVSVEYILYGNTTYHQFTENEIDLSIQENPNFYVKKIPLIDWSDVKNIKKLKNQKSKNSQIILSHLPYAKQCYALPVIGDSMLSITGPYSFPDNALIIFDPMWSDTLTDGIFIIAQVNNNILFRQVKFDGSKAYLHALNPQYPKIFESFKIIGKVIEMQMQLP